ncbi:MAG: hypothetical protein ACRDHP_18985, partial [Ktedonobacterales bacterium]
MALVLVNFARPVIRDGRRTGPARLLLSGALVTLFALAIIVWNVSAIVIVIGAACLGVALYTPGKLAVEETANASEKRQDVS